MALVWKFVLFAVAGSGLFLALHLFTGQPNFVALNFFTILSALLSAVYFLVDGIWMARNFSQAREGAEWCITLKHIVLTAVLLTGIVANTLLVGVNVPTEWYDAASATLLHKINPVLVFADFLLLEKHCQITVKSPFVWCVFPLCYCAYIMVVCGALHIDVNHMDPNSLFPYPFLDFVNNGVPYVAGMIGAIVVGYLLISYILLAISRLIAKFAKR